MLIPPQRLMSLLALALASCLACAEQGVDRSAASIPDMGFGSGAPPSYGLAVAEILANEAFVNSFDRFVSNKYWAYIDLDSWKANLEGPWVFDRDPYLVNEIGHPAQGSFYFSVGRSNGLDFWESALGSALGSAVWELFGETHTPDINDFITTTLGGAALGEMLHRLYTVAKGENSRLQYVVPSLDAANYALYSRSPSYDKAEGRLPLSCSVAIGLPAAYFQLDSLRGPEAPAGLGNPAVYFDESLSYGDPFESVAAPFDYFEQRMIGIASPPDYGLAFFSSGNISSYSLVDGRRARLNFETTLDYDFLYSSIVEFSANALGLGLQGSVEGPSGIRLAGRIGANFLALSTNDSVYLRNDPDIDIGPDTARDYDFGAGAGVKIELRASQPLWGSLSLDYLLYDMQRIPYALIGDAPFDYALVGILDVSCEHTLSAHLAVGASYALYYKDAFYDALPNAHEDIQAVGAYLKFIV
jgi:hypothetical protein